MDKERISKITKIYYSRQDVQKTIFDFSQNREVVPRYFDFFGKRPDFFQYQNDIFELVKKGATSFHCSEEIWSDPSRISTEMTLKELNELKTGWDLIIDIDCKWFEFSKKATKSIIQSLKFYGIKNFGVKFSGGKGFHIIVPWKSFPQEINNIKTSEKFPEWPRIIVNYLKELSRPILENLIKDDSTDFTKVEGLTGIRCENCKNISSKKFQITLECKNHKIPHTESFVSTFENYTNKKCPHCNNFMEEKIKKEFYRCDTCKISSIENQKNFHEKIHTDVFKLLGLDLILVSSRHLFRMPYSLHEKTCLASVVLSEKELENFNPQDANPLKVKVKNFMPDSEEGEASNLLREALDWDKNQSPQKNPTEQNEEREFQPIKIEKFSEDILPPSIKKILEGMKDGKKRALFVLINFFRSIRLDKNEVEKMIKNWNSKNETPLKDNYITSQMIWSYRNKIVPPPNYDKDYYLGIGIKPTEEELKSKNPLKFVSLKISRNKTKTKN